MKNLQDYQENSHSLPTHWNLKTIEFQPDMPKSLTLLLHGYSERGLRIFRKMKRSLPSDSYIIAPNGPFPLPKIKPDKLDFGYAWYFYNRFNQNYQIDQTLSVELLRNLLIRLNPQNLPVTVIGFSQGGYLAPLLGFMDPNVKHIIGIGCEFKRHFFSKKPTFTMDAIHGAVDEIVSPLHAKAEVDYLRSELGLPVKWHSLPAAKHEITSEVTSLVTKIMEQYGEASL